jgi:hypothetical protein
MLTQALFSPRKRFFPATVPIPYSLFYIINSSNINRTQPCRRLKAMDTTTKALVMVFILISTALSSQISISGKVTSLHYNKPLDSCIIQLHPQSPTAKADSIKTDINGQFSIAQVWPGVYIISATKTDYMRDSQLIVINNPITINFILLKSDYCYTTDLPDTLKKSTSPFFIAKPITIDHSIIIEHGAAVYLKDSLQINGPSIFAEGKDSDTIKFKGLGINSVLTILSPQVHFAQCSFDSLNGILLPISTMTSFNECFFYSTEIRSWGTSGLLNIKKCRFLNSNVNLLSETLLFDENIIYNPERGGLVIDAYGKIKISDNTVLSAALFSYLRPTDTIINNLFKDFGYCDNNQPIFFAYNAIPQGSINLPGVGQPKIKNDFGEPCDLYFNIFSDPLIADSSTGALQKNSPCLKAGMNGTNIGAWKNEGIFTRIITSQDYTLRNTQNGVRTNIFMNNEFPRHLSTDRMLSNNRDCFLMYSLTGRRIKSNPAVTGNSTAPGKMVRGRIANGFYVLKNIP